MVDSLPGNPLGSSISTGEIDTGAVTEVKLGISDNTTKDVTSTAHGFAPKSPADTTKFLRGGATPDWAVPAGGWVKEAETTAAGAETSIDFSNLTAGDFYIVEFQATTTGTGDMVVNNDTAANYKQKYDFQSANNVNTGPIFLNDSGNMNCCSIILIPNRTNRTTGKKITVSANGFSTPMCVVVNAMWSNSATINRLTFRITAGNAFGAGDKITIWRQPTVS